MESLAIICLHLPSFFAIISKFDQDFTLTLSGPYGTLSVGLPKAARRDLCRLLAEPVVDGVMSDNIAESEDTGAVFFLSTEKEGLTAVRRTLVLESDDTILAVAMSREDEVALCRFSGFAPFFSLDDSCQEEKPVFNL